METGTSSPRNRLNGWAISIFVGIFCYLASPGPIVVVCYWIWNVAQPPWLTTAFDIVYAPLDWVATACPPVGDFYRWYVIKAMEAANITVPEYLRR